MTTNCIHLPRYPTDEPRHHVQICRFAYGTAISSHRRHRGEVDGEGDSNDTSTRAADRPTGCPAPSVLCLRSFSHLTQAQHPSAMARERARLRLEKLYESVVLVCGACAAVLRYVACAETTGRRAGKRCELCAGVYFMSCPIPL